MPGPGPPSVFCFFVFSRPPATSEGPGLPLTERSKTLAPGKRVASIASITSAGHRELNNDASYGLAQLGASP